MLKQKLCGNSYGSNSSNRPTTVDSLRTEHPLQPNQTADVTVKVQLHVLISITHSYDVIELVIQVEAFDGETGDNNGPLECHTVFDKPSKLSLTKTHTGCINI